MKDIKPFISFLLGKVGFVLIALFVVMNLVFILPRLMPSSPTEIMMGRIAAGQTTSIGTGGKGTGSPVEVMIEVYNQKFGLYEPLRVKYIKFWKRFLTLDFGISFWRYPRSISWILANRLPWTLALVLPILPLGFVVGNWIGTRAAFYRGKLDNLLYYLSMYLMRAPYYWFALVFLFIFAVKLEVFPIGGAYSAEWAHPSFDLSWFLNSVHHWILPFMSLLGLGIGGWAVGMRAMSIYEMESDYITFTKQLGFSKKARRRIIERNAILPNFTMIPLTIRGLISQTLLVEVVFGYPGLGTVFYNAIFARDYPLIESTVMITVLIVLIGNLMADIIYGQIDPRIATGYVREK